MTAGLRLFRLGALIVLTWSPAAWAAEDADPVLEFALQRACDLGAPASLIVSIDQHLEGDDADAELVRNARGWIEDYNEFANSVEARLLAAYADAAQDILPAGAFPPEVCRVLRPVLAIALSADVLRSRGGQLSGGALLSPSKDAVLAPSIHDIVERCRYQPLQVPVQPSC